MLLQELFDRRNGLGEYSEFAQATHDDRTGLNSPRSAPLNEDTSLVERLRNGDDEAFEEMVRKYGGRLLATARRYLRSDDDACDALQDAFLRAFKSINTFKGDAQLSTWLHRILVNSALMHLRLKRRHPATEGMEIDELLPRFDPAGNWIDEGMSTMPAHVSFELSETKTMVRRCIDQLPDTYRIVLMLRDIEELDTEEVARLLDLTPNNLKVRLHRGRQALKVLIEREQTL
jgi:RNA polymerase sigma-70 factor, ECF subfamily